MYPVGAENPRELTKITEVNQFVQDLLGVNASQFRQLIILPQGEVQRFLMADSKTKEEILTTLFQTQLYTNWVTKLDERAKSMRDQTQDITSQLKVLMGQVDGVSDQLELDQWQVAVGDLLTEKRRS
ncbi:AAA family ATPase [Limosilactobacillus fermentum]